MARVTKLLRLAQEPLPAHAYESFRDAASVVLIMIEGPDSGHLRMSSLARYRRQPLTFLRVAIERREAIGRKQRGEGTTGSNDEKQQAGRNDGKQRAGSNEVAGGNDGKR